MSDNESDRRSAHRTPIELRVEYRRLNMFFSDYARNISKGGTFVRTDNPLPLGTEFVFALVVPQFEEPLALQGKVIWHVKKEDGSNRQPGMGIEFQYQSDEDRERVMNLVRTAMKRELGEQITNQLLPEIK